jgi:hypothetical protein
VAAGDKEAERRERDTGIFEKGGLEMGGEVADADQGLLEIIREALGKREADEERSNEARALGHGKKVDRVQTDVRAGQAFADDGIDRPDVLARGEFGNDPAVGRVDFILGEDDIAQDLGSRGKKGT